MGIKTFPMRTTRALVATDPRCFGRAVCAHADGRSLSDDARLFTATFAAGFLFVSILIG